MSRRSAFARRGEVVATESEMFLVNCAEDRELRSLSPKITAKAPAKLQLSAPARGTRPGLQETEKDSEAASLAFIRSAAHETLTKQKRHEKAEVSGSPFLIHNSS